MRPKLRDAVVGAVVAAGSGTVIILVLPKLDKVGASSKPVVVVALFVAAVAVMIGTRVALDVATAKAKRRRHGFTASMEPHAQLPSVGPLLLLVDYDELVLRAWKRLHNAYEHATISQRVRIVSAGAETSQSTNLLYWDSIRSYPARLQAATQRMSSPVTNDGRASTN